MEFKITERQLSEITDLMEKGWVVYDITTGNDWLDVCLLEQNTGKSKDFYLDSTH